MTRSVIVGCIVIRTFKDHAAEEIWHGRSVRRIALDLQRAARRKLRMLNNAQSLSDLLVPPGNRLELLRGDRTGQHSIRINDQWRICFVWRDGGADEVEIVDYH
jgi:proteic killer suppression protein